MISYAQHYEDIILYALLHDRKDGFYVDVGANHPVNDSVTKFFYQRGWSGINIEPMPSIYKLLVKSRPRDTNLNVGIAQKKGTLKLREIGWERHGLSSFTPSEKIPDYLPYTEYDVKVMPLKEALRGVKKIDFLKVDVEGMEHEVLSSHDWTIRPEVLAIEDNNSEAWLPLVTEHGYREVCFDGLNRYFVPLDSRRNLEKYQSLLNEGVVTLREYRLNKKVETLTTQLQDMYEKHTELGMQWHAIHDRPEDHLSWQQLRDALQAQAKRKISAKSKPKPE